MDYEKIEQSEKRRRILGKGVTYLFLTIWALIVLFPFYWMLLTSVKSYGAYNAEHIPAFFTASPTLENYKDAFTAVPLAKYLLNTLIFTVITTAIMMVVITLAAYAFARLSFPGKNLVFTLFLSLMMIPAELVVITKLCDDHEPEPPEHLHGTDSSLGDFSFLHLSFEGKFRAGARRALPGGEGGRNLGPEIPL